MNPNHLFLLIALFSSFQFFSPSSAHNKSHEASNPPAVQASFKGCFSKVFAFGDSYTDTGNAQSLTGGSSSDKPSSNGRLVVDFLCDALSLPSLPPFKATASMNFSFGANFALAGSTALPHDFFFGSGFSLPSLWKEVTAPFETQVEWFNKFLQEEFQGKSTSSCKTELEKSLFWIGAMGVHDYARGILSSFPLQRLAEMSLPYVAKLIETMLESGAKYIVVQGLPPVGCLTSGLFSCPFNLRDKFGCAAGVNSAVMFHNTLLQKTLADFRVKFPSCTIVYADYWNAFLTILKNPTKFNFEEPFKACCGASSGELNFDKSSMCGSKGSSTCNDPSKFINWDGIHLTEAMYSKIADLFLHQGFCQPSFDTLIKNKSGM